MKFFAMAFFLLNLFMLNASGAPQYVWWEGESAYDTNFPKSTWFSTGALNGKHDLLSNGQWLTNEGNRTGDEAYAKYKVTVPEAGEYDFWVRKFWKHGPFRWRFGNDEWRTVDRNIALADSVEIITNLGANWIYAGSVTLPQGETEFELRLLAGPGESLTACFDAFLLTQLPFVPRGKLKPDEKSGKADPGFFPWEPDLDDFQDNALLDLRSLNENQAGMHGFIQSKSGDFSLGNGEPVRFWAVNVSSEIAALNRQSVRYLARSLAKRGVNMVRYHSPLFDRSDVMHLDKKRLDDLHNLIQAMKEEGIYTTVSFYFPLWFNVQAQYGISGYDTIDNKVPFALLYFDERMQEIYYSWAKELLTTKNPYTGNSIGNDPAVAIVEIINEDSFFFWTFTKNNIPAVHWAALEERFGAWLGKKYGSLQSAFQAWGNLQIDGDNAEEGRVGLYDAWHMTGDAIRQANANKKKRTGDQVQFLTELQREFYHITSTYFRNDLGVKNLIGASNWHVTDANILGALERYTYTAGDVIDRHGYFGGKHTSSDGRSSYSVAAGHEFSNLAATTVPDRLPLQFIQIEGYPHIITEIGWTNPNLYRTDYAFLASVYGALQGIDGFYTFAVGGAAWDTGMRKFALSCPVILGNFPAYALLYRKGYVQQGEPVIRQVLSLDNLYALQGSGDFEAQALDAFRQKDVPPGESATGKVSGFDPFSFYTGPVLRTFKGDPNESREANLASWIDRDAKTIRSRTGEVVWNYGDGIVTLDTPKAKGAAGFLSKSDVIPLSTIKIDCDNDYVSVMLVSLDNRPLEQSDRILIQAMTVERPYGFRASNGKDGTIQDMGGYPFGVEKLKVKIAINDSRLDSAIVTALDENGYATQQPVKHSLSEDKQWLQIELNENSVYHVIQRSKQTSVLDWSVVSTN